jgi:hypothetical protein
MMERKAGVNRAKKCFFQFGVLKSKNKHNMIPSAILPNFSIPAIFTSIENIKANGMAQRRV